MKDLIADLKVTALMFVTTLVVTSHKIANIFNEKET